jgi:uncharacterized membrane protein YbhN (UPF0104 family)
MRTRVRKLIALSAIILFVGLAWKYVDFNHLSKLSLTDLLIILVPVILFTLTRTYVFAIAMRPFAINLNFREWFGLGVYASILNLALPFRSGLSIKAIYLKRRHTFGFAKFVGMQGAISLIQLFTTLAIGSLALLVTAPDWRIAVVPFLLTIAIPIAALILQNYRWSPKSKLLQIIANMYHSFFQVVRSEQGVMRQIMLSSILTFIFNCLALYTALTALNVENGLTLAISIAVTSILINLINITPGNFGLLEFSAGIISNYLNAGFDDGFLATLVVRSVSIAFLFSAAPFFFSLKQELEKRDGD